MMRSRCATGAEALKIDARDYRSASDSLYSRLGNRRCNVLLGELHPTQHAIGLRAVAHKQRKIEKLLRHPKRLRRVLHARCVPAVIGPDDRYYIVDHHHWSLALMRAGFDDTRVAVIADLSWLAPMLFWTAMRERGWVNAVDAQGRAADAASLPTRLSDMHADPYRDLAWSVRRAGGFAKSCEPYSEFRWADFFRARIARGLVDTDFDAAHEQAMALAGSPTARSMPGALCR